MAEFHDVIRESRCPWSRYQPGKAAGTCHLGSWQTCSRSHASAMGCCAGAGSAGAACGDEADSRAASLGAASQSTSTMQRSSAAKQAPMWCRSTPSTISVPLR
jgi:hypothetical protein